jgi:D-glycero-alpha-D-manno-heptose-7-phosphate kinase
MIISRTPYRISFFGGGTDYPVWYEKHGGCVLSATINRYCYISCRYLPPFFGNKHRIVYSQIETVQSLEEIKHPAVRECLRFLSITDGLEIHHDGDLPKQTGLGTSSSFAVGLLHVLHALHGRMVTPMQLAMEAIHVERNMCHEAVGSQDQVAAAHGGLNHIRFAPGDVITVHPVTVSAQRKELFQRHLMLFFTGFSRLGSEVAAEQIKNTPGKENELKTMQEFVAEGIRILTDAPDILSFGRLLHEGWKLKRSLSSKVSNDQIDSMYNMALKAGATGGKLCGAGGGGFLLLFVEPDKQPAVRKALKDYLYVPFEIESLGSQIIVFQPDALEPSPDVLPH